MYIVLRAAKCGLFYPMDITEIIGLSAGICTSASSVPQILKTIKEKKAADVSPLMFLVLLAGNVLWVGYGIRRSDLPVTITNCISVLLDLTMLYLRYKFRYKN